MFAVLVTIQSQCRFSRELTQPTSHPVLTCYVCFQCWSLFDSITDTAGSSPTLPLSHAPSQHVSFHDVIIYPQYLNTASQQNQRYMILFIYTNVIYQSVLEKKDLWIFKWLLWPQFLTNFHKQGSIFKLRISSFQPCIICEDPWFTNESQNFRTLWRHFAKWRSRP